MSGTKARLQRRGCRLGTTPLPSSCRSPLPEAFPWRIGLECAILDQPGLSPSDGIEDEPVGLMSWSSLAH